MTEKQKKKKPKTSIMLGRNPETGEPIRKYFYGKTWKEVNKKKEDFKRKLEYGIDMSKESITVSEWIDVWYTTYVLGAKRIRPLASTTKAGYVSRMNQLKEAIGGMKMKDVREMHLQQAANSVRGQSKDVATKYVGMIKRIFGRARSNKIIIDNPAEYIDTPQGTRGKHRALKRWEADLILNNWNQHRAGLWAMTMMLTGMRRGELMAQDWSDIDLDNRRISIHTAMSLDEANSFKEGPTKSEAGVRVLPICSALMEVFESIPEDKRHGKLCVPAKGGTISPTSFRRGWSGFRIAMWRIANGEEVNQQGKRNDLNPERDEVKEESFNWRAHDMRFTFATAMYEAGVPVKAAQYYMGHADLRLTLELYTELSAEREKESNIQLVTFLDKWLYKNANEGTLDADLALRLSNPYTNTTQQKFLIEPPLDDSKK